MNERMGEWMEIIKEPKWVRSEQGENASDAGIKTKNGSSATLFVPDFVRPHWGKAHLSLYFPFRDWILRSHVVLQTQTFPSSHEEWSPAVQKHHGLVSGQLLSGSDSPSSSATCSSCSMSCRTLWIPPGFQLRRPFLFSPGSGGLQALTKGALPSVW